MKAADQLERDGFSLMEGGISPNQLEKLRDTIFTTGNAGERCLLDHSMVRETALHLHGVLHDAGILTNESRAIQAIAFDKNSDTNWKVPWHQDLMFPFKKRVTTEGFDVPSVKQGVDYARPPVPLLERLLAVRLHLDDCGLENGPLRISPTTHLKGILASGEIAEIVKSSGEAVCVARIGQILLMRPLALHASSQATEPKHRRVLHFVYDSGGPVAEPWHRAV